MQTATQKPSVSEKTVDFWDLPEASKALEGVLLRGIKEKKLGLGEYLGTSLRKMGG